MVQGTKLSIYFLLLLPFQKSQDLDEEYSLRHSQLLSLSMDSDTCSNGGGSEHTATFRGDACHSMN